MSIMTIEPPVPVAEPRPRPVSKFELDKLGSIEKAVMEGIIPNYDTKKVDDYKRIYLYNLQHPKQPGAFRHPDAKWRTYGLDEYIQLSNDPTSGLSKVPQRCLDATERAKAAAPEAQVLVHHCYKDPFLELVTYNKETGAISERRYFDHWDETEFTTAL